MHPLDMLDWDDLRIFLAVARCGTMSSAARTLRVAQPTVGRRIARFEKDLGARVFSRSPAGLVLTPAGQHLRAHAEKMEREALTAMAVASGRDEGVRGKVIITASEWLVRSVLGPVMVPFIEKHPALALELVADPRHLNLARREADIALRPSRFRQLEVFQREVAVVEFGLYASDGYLAAQGAPDFSRGCEGSSFIAVTEEMRTVVDADWLPSFAGRARIAARVNGREAMATMAAAGLGIACLPRILGDATPSLRLLRPPQAPPRRKLWLGVHRSARTIPRVKATLAYIATSFEQLRPKLSP